MNISFVGAGNVASSLGNLFANAGHKVNYGTQNPIGNQLSIADAIFFGEVVCFAIPFSAMKELLTTYKENLKGKIVVDITNAIHNADWSTLFLGEDSGGEQTARLLPKSKVVKAFNTIFADVMKTDKQLFEGQKLTAFIASDDIAAAAIIKKLADLYVLNKVYHWFILAKFFLILIINLSGVTLGRLLKNQFIKPTIFLPLPFKNNSTPAFATMSAGTGLLALMALVFRISSV